MNKKILFSLVSICSVVGMVTGSALAAFTSSATNSGNTFGAGSLTLSVAPNGGSTSTPAFIVTDIAPGQSREQALILTNSGSIAATSVMLKNIEHTGSTPDLGDKLTLNLYDDNGTTPNVFDVGDTLKGSAHITDAAWTNIPLGFGLTALTGTHTVIAVVTFDADSDDTYQGKTSAFNLVFQANQ